MLGQPPSPVDAVFDHLDCVGHAFGGDPQKFVFPSAALEIARVIRDTSIVYVPVASMNVEGSVLGDCGKKNS